MNPFLLILIILVLARLAFRLRPMFASSPLAAGLPQVLPNAAAPRQPPDCGIPTVGVTKQAGLLTLENISGGEHWADTVVIKGHLDLTSHLTVMARDLIEVQGVIRLNAVGGPGAVATRVTLACPTGDVWIRAAGNINGENPAPYGAASPNAVGMAQGGAGTSGGHIVLIGTNVTHDGRITGSRGGGGGSVSVTGGPIPSASTAAPGSAVAVGGSGGHGGDVLICATEMIRMSTGAFIHGGESGHGGRADVTVPQSGDAFAGGGHAGHGGAIMFKGRGGACGVRIGPGAELRGSWPPHVDPVPRQDGGYAVILRDLNTSNLSGAGGFGEAVAGNGGEGGEITFDGCQVENLGTILSGCGGLGGGATAEAGFGWSDPQQGRDGGYATANGGGGGKAGPEPAFTDTHGNPGTGSRGEPGYGGNASATPGDGGTAGPNATGGASGYAKATGGSNGDGTTPGEVDEVKSNGPQGAAGGTARFALASGR